jgi:hypothetical protein
MNSKIKIEIGFGVGEDKDRNPLQAVDQKLERVAQYVAANFGGYTFISTTGGWINPQGILVSEAGMTLFIMADDTEDNRVNAGILACFVRDVMHQACVAFTITQCQFQYL